MTKPTLAGQAANIADMRERLAAQGAPGALDYLRMSDPELAEVVEEMIATQLAEVARAIEEIHTGVCAEEYRRPPGVPQSPEVRGLLKGLERAVHVIEGLRKQRTTNDQRQTPRDPAGDRSPRDELSPLGPAPKRFPTDE